MAIPDEEEAEKLAEVHLHVSLNTRLVRTAKIKRPNATVKFILMQNSVCSLLCEGKNVIKS